MTAVQPVNVRWIDADGGELQHLVAMRDELAAVRPLLYVTVHPAAMRARGDEPAALHRFLADIGYVPELLEESGDVERWMFQHPDGTRP